MSNNPTPEVKPTAPAAAAPVAAAAAPAVEAVKVALPLATDAKAPASAEPAKQA